MKKNVCIYIILSVVSLFGCSKREVFHPVWHKYTVEVRYNNDADSTLSKTGDMYTTYIYAGDSLIRTKRSVKEEDTLNIAVGEYNFITVNLTASGVRFGAMENFKEASLLLNTQGAMITMENPLRNVFASTVKDFSVMPNIPNILNVNLANQVRSIEYQLIIEGKKDSLERCIITQNGVSKGFLFHNNQLIFDPVNNLSISADASRENNFTGSFNLLGIDPDNKELKIKFIYNNQKVQNTTLELSQLEDEYIYSKRLIIYIDISRVNMELNATVKSWIIVEDKINI